MRVRTEREEAGIIIINEETGEELGVLASSVGPHGASTGVWSRCKTTSPLSEAGVTHVDGRVVAPYE